MPRITLNCVVNKNFKLVFTVKDLKDKYLAGLPIPDSITDQSLEFFVESSIVELESFLGLKIARQIITENRDFFNDDWRQWGFMHTTYPVVCPVQVDGYLGATKQISYPRNWLSSRKTSDDKWYSRMVHIVPTTGSTHSEAIIYSGILPHVGYNGSKQIPNYWTIKYVTGWLNPPLDLLNGIGMLSACKVLQNISDALMIGAVRRVTDNNGQPIWVSNGTSFGGLGFGVASKSVSIDGLSQSTSSYVNGQTGVWGARLKQYADLLDPAKPGSLLARLYDQYAAVTMGVG